MRIEFILLGLAFVYLIYKVATHYYQKKQDNRFVDLADKEDNLFLYLSELHQLCGNHINANNKLEQLEAILEGVRSAGFEILSWQSIDKNKAVLFTRINEELNIENSIINYELQLENDYLITFDEEKEEVKITTTLFTDLEDKNIKNDFARVFLKSYREI